MIVASRSLRTASLCGVGLSSLSTPRWSLRWTQLASPRCGSQPPFPPIGKRCQRRRGDTRSQRCPRRHLLCSTAGQPTAPAGLAVSRGFFPAVDFSCLGLSQCATGRLGVWLLVMPRTGTADWPEKVRQKNKRHPRTAHTHAGLPSTQIHLKNSAGTPSFPHVVSTGYGLLFRK